MSFKRFGIMLDMSRNAVMHVPALKKFIVTLSDMGYNTLLLYTEDTYEIPGEPYFGHFRGRYSQQELRQIVDFAGEQGMEVIPCIQTLAHLNAIFKWPVYNQIRDCNDILLADEEKTYQLIGKMLDSVKACYRSEYVHIGMDEAHMVGLGKHLDRFGYEDRFALLSRHLKRVCQMVTDRGLKSIMWGDMFFRLKNNGVYNCYEPIVPTPEEVDIPQEVAITNWDYYSADQARYEIMLRAHKQLGNPVWYAGGIWTWTGFAPDNAFSLRSTLAAIRACRVENIENIFMTIWGDDGNECPRYAALSALYAAACFARGEESMEKIKADFEDKYHIPFDAFQLLDLHVPSDAMEAKNAVSCQEKYLLYNDPFLGICDSTLSGNENAYYARTAEALKPYINHPEYGNTFRMLGQLALVLSRKAELGVRTRALYQAVDKPGIRQLIADYEQCILDTEAFLCIFRSVWMAENKPHGFEIQEIRIGGLIQRLRSCKERLEQWCSQDTPIPELAEQALDLEGGGTEFTRRHFRYPNWIAMFSPNVASMI